MIISTRGRYALRVIIDLAENCDGSYIPMKTVAARQDISLKYLEQILPVLTKNGIVEATHGKGGGYRLAKSPEDCSVFDVLKLTEELAPVSCLVEGAKPCEKKARCKTIELWRGLEDTIKNYLSNYSIADLITENDGDNYVI